MVCNTRVGLPLQSHVTASLTLAAQAQSACAGLSAVTSQSAPHCRSRNPYIAGHLHSVITVAGDCLPSCLNQPSSKSKGQPAPATVRPFNADPRSKVPPRDVRHLRCRIGITCPDAPFVAAAGAVKKILPSAWLQHLWSVGKSR